MFGFKPAMLMVCVVTVEALVSVVFKLKLFVPKLNLESQAVEVLQATNIEFGPPLCKYGP